MVIYTDNPREKLGVVDDTDNPSSGETETGGFLELTGQTASPNLEEFQSSEKLYLKGGR